MAQQTDARPMRRDALRNQRLILQAAREVVSDFGTEASMELIAGRAGVGVGTVYRRFPNKEALLDELLRLIVVDLIDAARQALAKGDGTGLESFLRALGAILVDHRGYAHKLVVRRQSDYSEELLGLIAELLGQAQRHGLVAREVTLTDVMATVWAIRGIIESTPYVPHDVWERHLDIHLLGLRSPDVPSPPFTLSRNELARIGRRLHPR